VNPTFSPSTVPSLAPSSTPSVIPTYRPSVSPSVPPTAVPSISPSSAGSASPTSRPPTLSPTGKPRPPTPEPTPGPTIAIVTNTVVQFSATSEITGITAAQVDDGVKSAFQEVTANKLSLEPEDIQITNVTDVVVRRLDTSTETRLLATSKVSIAFVVYVILEQTEYDSAPVAVDAYDALLTQLFTSPSVGSDLVTLAVSLGSTTIDSNTVIVCSAPIVNRNFTIIEVRTGAPTAAPVASRHVSGGNGGSDTTPIIIGAVVGGCVFLALVGGLLYYLLRSKKIEPM